MVSFFYFVSILYTYLSIFNYFWHTSHFSLTFVSLLPFLKLIRAWLTISTRMDWFYIAMFATGYCTDMASVTQKLSTHIRLDMTFPARKSNFDFSTESLFVLVSSLTPKSAKHPAAYISFLLYFIDILFYSK